MFLVFSVRALDQNRISANQFYAKMSALGIALPDKAKKLVDAHESHGRVDFKSFVRALEPMFETKRSIVHSGNHEHRDDRPETSRSHGL